ncbi:alpha/beta fold hydrolase [Pontibacter vulgaris]|uniref:alpha/beta fold hydrolase n=1 Tax=Pontibacter vulgaris TaxID=2905679 RepID=UPI001FA77061|nr:alpha/beta hydrolase [Pontibacter vulgaris]
MENLILLHGALGSAATLAPLKNELEANYRIYTLDFSGHGGKPLPESPFAMPLFAQNILQLMEQEQLERAHIFGYSMGGYAALYFALQYPERVKSIFTLATKFAWSAEAAEKEGKMLNPEKIQEKVPHFAQTLAQRHAPQRWQDVMLKTAEMMRHLGDSPALTASLLAQIQVPVLVAVGDRDNMVTPEETIWTYRQLANASLLVLPDTRHPLEAVSPGILAQTIRQFLAPKNVTIS